MMEHKAGTNLGATETTLREEMTTTMDVKSQNLEARFEVMKTDSEKTLREDIMDAVAALITAQLALVQELQQNILAKVLDQTEMKEAIEELKDRFETQLAIPQGPESESLP